MKHLSNNTPFWTSVYEVHIGKIKPPSVSFGAKPIDYFTYQLAVHKMELSLNARGMKMTRHWRVTPLKEYYGISGNAANLLKQIEEIIAAYKQMGEDN